MPDIREEFEACYPPPSGARWLSDFQCYTVLFPRDQHEALTGIIYQARWQAWQASRAALRVELPPTITVEEAAEHFNIDEEGIDMAVDVAHMVNGAIWACAAFIKQAGIEVK